MLVRMVALEGLRPMVTEAFQRRRQRPVWIGDMRLAEERLVTGNFGIMVIIAAKIFLAVVIFWSAMMSNGVIQKDATMIIGSVLIGAQMV